MSPVPTSSTPPLPYASSSSWMQRNWPWFVAGMLVVLAAFVGGLFFLITHLLKTSDAYVETMQRVRAHPRAVAVLGEPIRDDSFVTGKLKYNDRISWAHFYTKLTGPKASAHLDAYATKENGHWVHHRINLTVDGTNEVIEVLKP